MTLDEIPDPELDLGSLIKFEQLISSDQKSFAVINSREEETQILKRKTKHCDKAVVNEEELKPVKSNKRKIIETSTPAKTSTPAQIEQLCYRTKFPVRFRMIVLIVCQLMSPVHAPDRPLVLAPDTCDYGWSNKPKDMSVTPGVHTTFMIFYECTSQMENIQIVFQPDNSSTPTNVWKLYDDERGNQNYHGRFKDQIQVVVDVKNGELNVTVNNIIIHQGRIFVWLDLTTGRIYIPLQQDGRDVNLTTRLTENNETVTTRKENRNVTEPPPVEQDDSTSPWIIIVVVVLIVVIVVLIILVILFWKQIGEKIGELRNWVMDAYIRINTELC